MMSGVSLWVPGTVSSSAWWQHSNAPPAQLHDECQTFSAPSTTPASAQDLSLLIDLWTSNTPSVLAHSYTGWMFSINYA